MRIVYCIAATCSPRGMERVLANKANYLASRGYEIHIITTDQRGRKPFFALDERIACYDLDINYEVNNGKSIINKLLQYPTKQREHKHKLTALLKQINADIVISMFCNDASFITKIKDGSKKILEIHFSKFKRLQYGRKGIWRLADIFRTWLDEKTVRRFDKFVVLTKEDKTYWGDIKNITVIPNPRSFSPAETATLENKKVIAVGGYTHQKGFDMLIDIWQKVCFEVEDWHLDIVGDGELRNTLQEKIDKLKIGNRISLLPQTKNISEKYLNSAVLALSSRYEGLPMALLEGQSFGLPSVAFECKCGPKDIITDGVDGFLVAEGDIDNFAARLIELILNDSQRKKMGAAAKTNSENYTEEKIMERWINLFESL